MPTYASWLNTDIGGLNDNLISAITASLPVAAVRVPTSTAYDTIGAASPVPAGKKWVNFVSSSDFVGTVNGADFPQSFSFMYPPQGPDTYAAIAYTITAGTLTITWST